MTTPKATAAHPLGEAACSARERVWAHDLKRQGGKWLGEARNWMQWNKHNGETVTWGSNQELRPTMTVAEVEDLAAHVAAGVMNEYGVGPNK